MQTTQSRPLAGLTAAQVAIFNRDGYLVVPDVLSTDVVAALIAETRRLLDSVKADEHPLTRFTTGGDDDGDHNGDNSNDGRRAARCQHVGDSYFLASNDKIRFFFEEGESAPSPSEPS